MTERTHVHVTGVVQGVGFRPFVFRLAQSRGLTGWVRNEPSGVQIEVEGPIAARDGFLRDLVDSAPPLARIRDVAVAALEPAGFEAFVILASEEEDAPTAFLPPDTATCDECLAELRNPKDRRYRYPFINCTNCGPRYTIIQHIPYDRPATTMSSFTLCPACRQEYENPADRRFHAQPNACPDCGPRLTAAGPKGREIDSPDPLAFALGRLQAGEIVAVKGLGGFHLACDAENEKAVARLRQRKGREEKPFAVMVRDELAARTVTEISQEEGALLTSWMRPIVLLQKKAGHGLAPSVAPRSPSFGVMLPYTPLHALLLDGPLRALVMTSGNISEEPIAFENPEAATRLHGIADAYLFHDRPIEVRADDSIARVVGGRAVITRRSRGYTPRPVFLPVTGDPVLALGADLKNAVCLTRGDAAFLSHHIGDLANVEALEAHRHAVAHLQRLLDLSPAIVAHDLHPRYGSTREALSRDGATLVGVQHHHAHIASVLAENRISEPVIGISLDGTGYGLDGTVWGGEFLIADLTTFTRAAALRPVPLPGSDRGVREGWRMAVSHLLDAVDDADEEVLARRLPRQSEEELSVTAHMARTGLNAPLTSSMGRLFDAVSALTGGAFQSSFEGQAAMEFEALAAPGQGQAYPVTWLSGDGLDWIDTRPVIRSVLNELDRGVTPDMISGNFHRTVIRMVSDTVRRIAEQTGLGAVALSGGCFQNALLTTGCLEELAEAGFKVYTHSQVPPNDGGIALGQAAVALSRMGTPCA